MSLIVLPRTRAFRQSYNLNSFYNSYYPLVLGYFPDQKEATSLLVLAYKKAAEQTCKRTANNFNIVSAAFIFTSGAFLFSRPGISHLILGSVAGVFGLAMGSLGSPTAVQKHLAGLDAQFIKDTPCFDGDAIGHRDIYKKAAEIVRACIKHREALSSLQPN